MRKFFFWFFALLVVQAAVSQKKQPPYVILISFDGFRYDYVSKYNLENFKKLTAEGAQGELIPSFPSKTFPNHYTLVTGLYPGHHGLVDNHFYDPNLKVRYTMKDVKVVTNPAFYGGTPLWQLAQQQGLKSASYFWVGSETEIQGKLPTYYMPFNDDDPNDNRISKTMEWLRLPEDQRPHFISLYFSLVDHAGHEHGPNSQELQQAVTEADRLLGSLMNELKKVNLPVNVVLVSDHGMLEMREGVKTFSTLSEIFNTKDPSVVFSNGGTQVQLYTAKGDSLYDVLKKTETAFHYKVYRKGKLPERWHYTDARCGDVLMVIEPGHYFQVNNKKDDWYPAFGTHGFDPGEVKDMRGIFYAWGPNVKSGTSVKPFENIHVYPFIAKILGLKTPKIDGDAKVLESVYKK